MSNGVFLPPTVTSNDVNYGEFKVYHNYDTPLEQLVGVARGGLTIEGGRDSHFINCDGVYGPMLDSDGIPMIRMNRFTVMFTLQMMYLKYFNILNISNAESTDNWESQDWGQTGGTYAADTTTYQTGLQSAKCTADTDTYGIHNVFTSSLDMTAFENGETSTTADKIGFALYLASQDLTDLGTCNIRIKFHMDAEGTETNHYYYNVAYSALTADMWNNFTIAKSAFTEVGTGDWSAVTGISFVIDGTPSAEVIFYVDTIDMLMTITDGTDGINIPLEGQGGGFSYTNETTYKKYVPKIGIDDTDYLHNVTIISTKHDGKMVKYIGSNMLNDGNIELAFGEKSEVVTNTQYTGHYLPSKGTTIPLQIKEYTT